MGPGIPQAPRWAWAVLLVGLVGFAVLLPVTLKHSATNAGESGLTASTSAGTASSGESTIRSSNPRRILAIGDSYTGGSDEGGVGSAGWPELVRSDLNAAGYDVTVDVATSGGAGYVAVSQQGLNFPLLADKARGYDLVIVFGSRNDTAGTDQIRSAANATFQRIASLSPRARLIVIGPPWVSDTPPTNVLATRQAVIAAARDAQAVFVDPIRDRWFTGPFQQLIGADGIHPTDRGHRHMADLITPIVKNVLDADAAQATASG